MNPTLQILVHEPTSRWTAEIERLVEQRTGIEVRWRPHRADLIAECASDRVGLVLAVCVAADQTALDLVRGIADQNRQVRLICLVPDPPQDWEWLARELGADVVLPDTLEPRRLRESVERCLNRQKSLHT